MPRCLVLARIPSSQAVLPSLPITCYLAMTLSSLPFPFRKTPSRIVAFGYGLAGYISIPALQSGGIRVILPNPPFPDGPSTRQPFFRSYRVHSPTHHCFRVPPSSPVQSECPTSGPATGKSAANLQRVASVRALNPFLSHGDITSGESVGHACGNIDH